VFETGSRGGLVALLFGLLMFGLSPARSAWHRLRLGVLACVAVLAVAIGSYEVPMMRYRLHATESSGNMAGREGLYPLLVQMFKEKPIIGWGPDNNRYELSLREGNRLLMQRDAHNILLEVLTNSGLVGGVVFTVALLLCLVAAWRARSSPEGILPLALAACVFMGNMSGNWMSSKLIWVLLAYAVASERRSVRWVRSRFRNVAMRRSRSAVL
jgi:O-antigen ligase